MRARHLFAFSLQLFRRKTLQTMLVFLALSLTIALLYLFVSFGSHVGKYVAERFSEEHSLYTLFVTRKEDAYTIGQSGVTEELAQEIQAREGVVLVARQKMLRFLNGITVSIAFKEVRGDMIFFGVEDNMLPDYEISSPDVIPIFLHQDLLDIYNGTIAPMLPLLVEYDEEGIRGLSMKVAFGQSSFLSWTNGYFGAEGVVERKAEVVALAENIPKGFVIPLSVAEEIEKEVLKEPSPYYHALFVRTQDEASFQALTDFLDEGGYLYNNTHAKAETMRQIAFFTQLGIVLVGLGIVLIAFLSLMSSLELLMNQEEKNMGILRSLGAEKKDIFLLFFFYVLSLVGGSTLLALLLVQGLTQWMNTLVHEHFTAISLFSGGLFDTSFGLFFLLVSLTLLLGLLLPVPKILGMTKKDPLLLLWK